MLLEYSDEGPGPVVVLLHGFPLNRTMWSGQLTGLGAVYRVIAPDLRGQGSTAAPGGVYTMELMADDAIETLDHLGLREPVVLGGLSMGGYVALAAMVKYPDRFRALILMDTRATADTLEAAANREVLARQVETSGDVTAVVDGMMPRLFSPLTREQRPEVLAEAREAMIATQPLGIIGALRGMAARPDRTADLASIRVPTLVLGGSDDVISTPDEMRRLAAAIPGALFEVIAEAGHLAPMEKPEAVNATLFDWLRRLA
jgi:pimeloyl-ACP methyl ester carboxylesterase